MIKSIKAKNVKEKLVGATGSVSGAASVLGSWQVCHNVCLGIIALLALVGITLTGMPLAFLTGIAVPMWIIAFLLLLISTGMYMKRGCISNRLLLLNSGFIIAGVPFESVQKFSLLFWITGGMLALSSAALFAKDRLQKWKGLK